VTAAWQPTLRFVPPAQIIDPEPAIIARRTWSVDALQAADTEHYLAIALA
jgi:hypothetical protein